MPSAPSTCSLLMAVTTALLVAACRLHAATARGLDATRSLRALQAAEARGEEKSLTAAHSADAQHSGTSAHAQAVLQALEGADMEWSTAQVIAAVLADLNTLAGAYNYDGGFILQAGTAVMAMGCRLDVYREGRRELQPGVFQPTLTAVSINPLHDVDVWIPSSDWDTLNAAITLNRRGGAPAAGGFEWAPGSALGNVHELDVRDGRKVWGDYRILSFTKHREDIKLSALMTRHNEVYILKCGPLLSQKEFLAGQTPCKRAHADGVNCDHPPDVGTPGRAAYDAAVLRGERKVAQDRLDKTCLTKRAKQPACAGSLEPMLKTRMRKPQEIIKVKE